MIWDNSRHNCKGRYKTDIIDNDYQHYYREHYSNCVDWVIYRNVWKDLTKILVEEMLINNYEWKFPCGLGSLQINKYKPKLRIKDNKLYTKNLKIDWKETKVLWESDLEAKEKKLKVYHTNSHTDGYKIVYSWRKPTGRENITRKFRFYPSRIIDVKKAEVLKKHLNKTDYFDLYKVKN